MNERERWTVYPLLFLALGASLKDKIIPTDELQTDRIRCQQIELVDLENQVKSRIDANMLVAPRIVTRDVRVLGAEDQIRISMGTNVNDAPRLEFFGQDRKPVLMMATDEANTTGMIIAFDAQNQPHFMITASVRGKVQTTPEDGEGVEPPAEDTTQPPTEPADEDEPAERP